MASPPPTALGRFRQSLLDNSSIIFVLLLLLGGL